MNILRRPKVYFYINRLRSLISEHQHMDILPDCNKRTRFKRTFWSLITFKLASNLIYEQY